MEKIVQKTIGKFKNVTIICTIVFLIIILFSTSFKTDNIAFLNGIFSKPFLIVWLAAIMLIIPIYLFFFRIDLAEKSKLYKYKILLFIVLIILQILFLFIFSNSTQGTDSYLVTDQAISIANGVDKKIDYNFSEYFSHYSNNNFILFITINLVKFFNLFKIKNYLLGLYIFNIVLIDLAVYFIYKIALKIKDEKFALKVLTLNILNPLNYFLICWVYTCTYSAVFVVGIIYLFFKLNENDNIKKGIVYSFILGLLIATGYLLRPIIIIPLIAIFICFFLKKESLLKSIKSCYIYIIIILLTCIFSYLLINNSMSKIVGKQNNTFPVTHWIMMGLHNNGTLSESDNSFTASKVTKAKMKEANIDEIKNTLRQYHISGFLNHLLIKLPITWDDGLSSYSFRIGQGENKSNLLYEWLITDKSTFIGIYCQAFRICILFFTLISVINLLKNYDLKKYCLVLTIFGAILFYLIWEAKNIYSYPFLTILMLLAADGMSIIKTNVYSIDISIIRRIVTVLTIVLVFLGIVLFNNFSRYQYWFKNNNISIYSSANNYNVNDIIKKDNYIVQEFTVTKKFNHVLIYVDKICDADSKYNIQLLSRSNVELANYVVSIDDIKNNSYIDLSINEDISQEKYYKIKISKFEGKKRDSIAWKTIKYKFLTNYNGNFYINRNLKKNQLYIQVYDENYQVFIGYKYYIFLIFGMIIFNFSNYLYFKHLKKTSKQLDL